MRYAWAVTLASALVPAAAGEDPATPPALSEFVADPQNDWDGDGRVTSSDEFVELLGGSRDLELAGWSLLLNDSTPVRWNLSGMLRAGEHHVFVNPTGELNNNGHVALLDPEGRVVDEVRFGSWPGAAGVLDANAADSSDESLRRTSDGWRRGHGTPGAPNDRPWVRLAWPFDARADAWWWRGGGNATLNASWVDADRTYEAAVLRMGGNASNATLRFLGGASWSATINVSLPLEDFEAAWGAVASDGERVPLANVTVRVDRAPPPVPLIAAPAWANGTAFAWNASRVEDAGVGGVEYRFETGPDGLNWTHATGWGPATVPPPAHAPTWLRARVRDAYGNENASEPFGVRLDADPPTSPNVTLAGFPTARLTWEPPQDNGSGLAAIVVGRAGAGGNRSWRLPADATRLEDDTLEPGDEPVYEVTAVDAAGNASPPAQPTQEWEGTRPHARLRMNRDLWGGGPLRIWVDFDRAMDEDQDAEVRWNGAALAGRWLANATTWSVVLDDEADVPDGEAVLQVVAAQDRRGHALWRPVERSLRVDRTPPELVVDHVDGWVNATGVRLQAQDALDPSPRIRYRVGNETEWTTVGGPTVVVPLGPSSRLEAVALDAAGGRSKPFKRTLHRDAEPPWARVVGVERGRWGVQAGDNASGLASVAFVHESGRALEAAREGPVWWVADAGNFSVRLTDAVGNLRVVDGLLPRMRPLEPDPPTERALPALEVPEADPARAPAAHAAPAPSATWGPLVAAAWLLARRKPVGSPCGRPESPEHEPSEAALGP